MGYWNRFFVLIFISAGGILFAQDFGTFWEVNGTVEIRSPDGTWVRAGPGDRIEKATLISSGFKSSAVISLGDSIVMLRPLTRLSLEEILQNKEGEAISLSLQTGRIRAEVSPPSGGRTDFTIRSPSAVASVRGTSFEFDTVNLRVLHGQVLYSRINGTQVPVAGGEMSYVDEIEGRVVSPFEAAAENLSLPHPMGSGSGLRGNTRDISPGTGTVGIEFAWD
ncbi:conserved hypothetical protein [Treponema primitia ZAS-2]|uniref:FecR protein domain-containing protein n=1 Tax=Treponema primitia (strain ATCC BAA-887 / DSM 12427 / ZAS-2) TaxID=545694 RepID=F5YKR2_TREPZ|nr:FecR family protein [Treponema primitia]AEF84897.1 conserved hypothetical protein [Treponema primitia ZAS-2]